MTHSSVNGFFFALDGPDGGGKTTQTARLVDWLREIQPREVIACRDPGGTALGDRLRSILLDRGTIQPCLRAEMLLYMASRAQLIAEIIVPALQAGKLVVSDRFLLANVVYQGYAGGLDVDELWRVGRSATGDLWPTLTILLDIPGEVARSRVGAPRDRMEDRPADFHARVRAGFLEAAKTYPAPIAIVDASVDAETLFQTLRNEVSRVLAINPRA
ncbi:MAG: hypothetical protein NVSMB14_13630 [Isosphaeraceae bacterium]